MSSANRSDAQRVADEVRTSLADSLVAALQNYRSLTGVAVVPKLRVTLRAPLARARGAALARAIAEACAEALAKESVTLGSTPADHVEGNAGRALHAIETLDGVRISHAVEAAAWLISLATDQGSVLRRASPFSELDHLPSAAAFAVICERNDARAVVHALGRKWVLLLAQRCTASEARRVLARLDDGSEPTATTWQVLRSKLSRACASHELDRNTLICALEGIFAQLPGAVIAARYLTPLQTQPSGTTAGHVDGAPGCREDVTETETETYEQSTCVGFWLLLPYVAPYVSDLEPEDACAVAMALAERLFGSTEDPAIAVLSSGGRPSCPPGIRLDRMAVNVLRDFARSLMRFERARCTYVLRAMLYGNSTVRPIEGGLTATLPLSPLRIVLERAGLTGTFVVPWNGRRLEIERDP